MQARYDDQLMVQSIPNHNCGDICKEIDFYLVFFEDSEIELGIIEYFSIASKGNIEWIDKTLHMPGHATGFANVCVNQ